MLRENKHFLELCFLVFIFHLFLFLFFQFRAR